LAKHFRASEAAGDCGLGEGRHTSCRSFHHRRANPAVDVDGQTGQRSPLRWRKVTDKAVLPDLPFAITAERA
jgi:hypothetical protein